jgi:hypothetical protein
MAHGQWTEVEARGVLDAWQKSGMPIWTYAKSRGLVPQRLYEWKRKLGYGRGHAKAKPVALMPVRVTEQTAAATGGARRGEPVTVLLRTGHMLKVGRDFDEHAFARVVALLERG